MYVVESGQLQQLLFETVPYRGVACPVGAQILATTFYTPLHLLASYGAAGLRVTHFASQVAKVTQVNVHVNGHSICVTLAVGTVDKMLMSGALFKAVFEGCAGKNDTFLIGF
jgi:hypothetical protein